MNKITFWFGANAELKSWYVETIFLKLDSSLTSLHELRKNKLKSKYEMNFSVNI